MEQIFYSTPPRYAPGVGWGNTIKNYRAKQEAITANLGWAVSANDAIVRPTARVTFPLYKVDKKGDRTELFDYQVLDLLERLDGSLRGKQVRLLHSNYMNFACESYQLVMKGDHPF